MSCLLQFVRLMDWGAQLKKYSKCRDCRLQFFGADMICKRVGLLAPEFKTDGNFVTVVFRYNRNGVNLQLVNSNPTSTQQAPSKYWNLSEY